MRSVTNGAPITPRVEGHGRPGTMPTYEYRCRACGHEFERFQKMSDGPVHTCPACERDDVERLISTGGGLLFKGPGFYATDYRKDGPQSRTAEDKKADKKADKPADAKADKKSSSSGAGSSDK